MVASTGQNLVWLSVGLQLIQLDFKTLQAAPASESDVICYTVGWLKDASQTLEYGKKTMTDIGMENSLSSRSVTVHLTFIKLYI
jgi:hypothetical protein